MKKRDLVFFLLALVFFLLAGSFFLEIRRFLTISLGNTDARLESCSFCSHTSITPVGIAILPIQKNNSLFIKYCYFEIRILGFYHFYDIYRLIW